jgi:DNA-nicking Smr family endonuclease
MKKRDLSDDEKELWKEFSKSTKPLQHQDQKTQETKPEKKKRINPVNLQDKEKYFAGDKKNFSARR